MSTENSNEVVTSAISTIIKLNTNPSGFGLSADELTAEMFVSPLPIQHSHSYFECEEQGIYIGVWDTTDMVETAGPYSCDEFMVILEGAVEIRNNKTGAQQTVLAGESFIIPQGYDCQWHQSGYLRKFYVISEPPTQTIPASPIVESIIKLPVDQTGRQYHHNNFSVDILKGNELNVDLHLGQCHTFHSVVRGELQITEANGTETSFTSGDAFVIPKGSHYQCKASANAVVYYVEL
jgi:uncharacterized cupin superfamily protein